MLSVSDFGHKCGARAPFPADYGGAFCAFCDFGHCTDFHFFSYPFFDVLGILTFMHFNTVILKYHHIFTVIP